MPVSKIVGAHFRPPAKPILAALHGDCPLELRPEPENKFDPNAIAVYVWSADLADNADLETMTTNLLGFGSDLETVQTQEAWHLGYIPRVEAEQVIGSFLGSSVKAKIGFTPTGEAAAVWTEQDWFKTDEELLLEEEGDEESDEAYIFDEAEDPILDEGLVEEPLIDDSSLDETDHDS